MSRLAGRESLIVWILGIPAFVGVSLLMLYAAGAGFHAAGTTLRHPVFWLLESALGLFCWWLYRKARQGVTWTAQEGSRADSE
jgi:hypothetical protein